MNNDLDKLSKIKGISRFFFSFLALSGSVSWFCTYCYVSCCQTVASTVLRNNYTGNEENEWSLIEYQLHVTFLLYIRISVRGCRYLWSVELLGEMCKNIKLSKGYIYIYFENNSSRKRYNSFPPFKRSRTRRISSDIHTPECLLKILLGHLPVQNIFYLVNDFLLLTSTCCTSDSLPCFFFFFFTCVPLPWLLTL